MSEKTVASINDVPAEEYFKRGSDAENYGTTRAWPSKFY